MTVEAVIFDWGGTLTPWRVVDQSASWRAYADVLHPADPALATEVAQALLVADTARWALARTEHRAFRLAEVLADAGVTWHEAAVAAYRDFWHPFTPTDPDAAAMLTRLSALGLRLGVLSSTAWPAEWHLEILRRDGVLDLLHGTTWSSSLDWTKPHAEAFQAAMTAIGVSDPSRCVFVGDLPYDDIYGASSLGMRTIHLPHDLPAWAHPIDVRPDAVVHRLADVAEVIQRWMDGAAPDGRA
jgi:FMN hydrolase / 5-amino-6-(5-phospho-D-ribitylamino)uracil phosphatase